MYLKMAKTDTWDEIRITLQDSSQKDYDYFEKSNIEVFVYGYPYHEAKATWLSASDLHQTYLKQGTNFVDEIEGYYVIVILDKAKGRCFIITDRYGVYHLFYSKAKHALVISDNISEIISRIPEVKLNRQSIIEFLNFDHVLGTKTHIETVEKFRPATVYSIGSDLALSQSTYWEYPSEERQALSKEEFLHLFNNHISTGLKLEEKISLPLSGGIDTRSILSASLQVEEHLHCYTHGLESSPDVRIARQISQMLRIPHDVYTLSGEWIKNIPSAAEQQAEIFNGLLNHIFYLHLENSYVNEAGKGDLFLSGIFGGELFRGYYVTNDVAKAISFDETVVALRKRLQYPTAWDIYQDGDSKEIEDCLTDAVKQELAGARDRDPIALSEYFCFTNYAPNFLSHSQRLAGRYFKIFNPILYRKFIEHSPRLDVSEKKSGYLQRYIIGMNSPALTRMLLATGQCVNEKDRQVRLKYYLAGISRYFRGGTNLATRKLFGRQVFSPSYFIDYASWLRNYHRQYVREVLDYEQMMLKHFFNRQRLESMINSFLMGRDDITYSITSLMSLELWLRRVLAK